MKASDYLIIPRSEIEELLKSAKSMQGNSSFFSGEVNAYKQVIEKSRPLLPLLEKAWDAGYDARGELTVEADEGQSKYHISWTPDPVLKQQFLDSEI